MLSEASTVVATKGDAPGHEIHGNQWSGGSGGRELYQGTSKTNALRIKEEGLKISESRSRTWSASRPEGSAIYATDQFQRAAYYGRKAAQAAGEDEYAIVRISREPDWSKPGSHVLEYRSDVAPEDIVGIDIYSVASGEENPEWLGSIKAKLFYTYVLVGDKVEKSYKDFPTRVDRAHSRLEHSLLVLERSLALQSKFSWDGLALKGEEAGHEFHGNQWSGVGATAKIRTFDSPQKIKNWGEKHYSRWEKGLDEDEKAAIGDYTSSDYRDLNRALRSGGDLNAHQQSIADQMDNALERAVVPERVMAYRSAGTGSAFPGDPEDWVGRTFQDSGFVSTSLDEKVAENWSGSYKMEIDVPKGSSGAYVENISWLQGESELLLPRGSQFKITGVRTESVVDSDKPDNVIFSARVITSRSNKGYARGISVLSSKASKDRDDYFSWGEGEVEWLEDTTTKGEEPGHEFRGNQYSGGGGESDYGSKPEEAMKWGQDNYAGWVDGLSSGERDSINSYTNKGDKLINKQLRRGRLTPAVQEQVDQIDAALERSKVPEDVVVYRNASSAILGDLSPEEAVGQVIQDRGYTSTSMVEFSLEHNQDVQLRITVPAGSRGAFIAEVSHWRRERELLLPRDTQIELTGYRFQYGTHYFEGAVISG